MIEFTRALPSIVNGVHNMPDSGYPCFHACEDSELTSYIGTLRKIVRDDRRVFFVDGKQVMMSLNWIRDHVHEMKGFKYWEYDIKSFLDFVIERQSDEGYYYELVKQYDEEHRTFVGKNLVIDYPEDGLSFTRLEIEADIEYLVVEGAMCVYKCTGDDEWMRRILPKLEKGINYMTSSEKRFDKERGLCKRAFTIDTWDFTSAPDGQTNRMINEKEMSIMHGDNSGVYSAMMSLSWIYGRFGDTEKSNEWKERACVIRENMMKYLWNGRFFMHQLHLNHGGIDNLERERMSLSCAYDLNRGINTREEIRATIEEYIKRRTTSGTFAEWFTVDPPYPMFLYYRPGRYVNGSVTPFMAGELAKAAFKNGYEEYGLDIIKRVYSLIKRDGRLYFLYDPKTSEGQGGGPSGWGAAALLSAIDEGLAGITDSDVRYRVMEFAPRFTVTEYRELRYVTGNEAQRLYINVRHIRDENEMRYVLECPSREVRCHILLPKGKSCSSVNVNDCGVNFKINDVYGSLYVDFILKKDGDAQKKWDISIEF